MCVSIYLSVYLSLSLSIYIYICIHTHMLGGYTFGGAQGLDPRDLGALHDLRRPRCHKLYKHNTSNTHNNTNNKHQ